MTTNQVSSPPGADLTPLIERAVPNLQDSTRHRISPEAALQFLENYRNGPKHMGGLRSGAVGRGIIDEILAQEGCMGLRIYLARKETGAPTLVVVGVNREGTDIANGIYADDVWPCPPFCPGDGTVPDDPSGPPPGGIWTSD